MLDAAVADRPVYAFASDHHSVWVNTAALAEPGIGTSSTRNQSNCWKRACCAPSWAARRSPEPEPEVQEAETAATARVLRDLAQRAWPWVPGPPGQRLL
jgi:predicted amidohydrolase YtcJ